MTVPTEREIIERSYELWKERGRPDHREELLRADAAQQLREESLFGVLGRYACRSVFERDRRPCSRGAYR